MPFVLPSDPSPGNVAPASWGDAVRAGLNYLANPPACRVYNSAALAVAHGVSTVLTFNSERFDTDSMHSTSVNTGRITINTAGVYQVAAMTEWQANVTGIRQLMIRLNGTTWIVGSSAKGDAASSPLSVSTIEKFVAGDYLEVLGWQNSGASVNVLRNANQSPEFAAAWIGLG